MASTSRHDMVVGAARLLAQRGLQQTSFTEVLELTGAPRGSIYHHFPDGKDQLVGEAIELAGRHAMALMADLEGATALEVTKRFLGMWRQVLTGSGLQAGCSVVAVTVATDSPELIAKVGEIFRGWRERVAELLHDGGLSADNAQGFSAVLISGAEGAVVLSRAEQSLEPFDLVAGQLEAQVTHLRRAARKRPSAAG